LYGKKNEVGQNTLGKSMSQEQLGRRIVAAIICVVAETPKAKGVGIGERPYISLLPVGDAGSSLFIFIAVRSGVIGRDISVAVGKSLAHVTKRILQRNYPNWESLLEPTKPLMKRR
jgi:hypothetical protein